VQFRDSDAVVDTDGAMVQRRVRRPAVNCNSHLGGAGGRPMMVSKRESLLPTFCRSRTDGNQRWRCP
jgi:hypothetical protein